MSDIVKVKLGQQGRLVVPAALRRAMGAAPGDDLSAYVDDGRLIVQTTANAARRIHGLYAHLGEPGASQVDGLIADRRAAARRERAATEAPRRSKAVDAG